MHRNVNKDTLLSAIEAHIHAFSSNLNCIKIGKIVSYENNWATCEITHKRTLHIKDDGSQIVKDYSPVKARVMFIGSGNTGQNLSLAENTPCLLLFSDREFNSYYQSGEVSPLADYRMHDLSDSLCIPLIWGDSNSQGYNIFSDKDINIVADIVNISATIINMSKDVNVNGILEASHLKANDGFTGDLMDSNGKKIATVVSGIIMA